MKVYDAKNLKYQDKLAEKRRRVLIFKILFFIGLAIAAIGFLFYLFFFSGLFEIREVSIGGLDKISKDEFMRILDGKTDSKRFGFLEYQKNIIFFNSGVFKAEALAAFPGIKDLSVAKKLPHILDINITEREAAGIWCFLDDGSNPFTTNCRYFDKEGNTWGEAAKSSGFLILNVDDNRRLNEKKPDTALLAGMTFILSRLKEINIFVRKFIIPENFIGDFRALTSENYDLIFSADSDIAKQLEVLKIFLAEKRDSSSAAVGFNPQYIDLRINGRIYYK